MSVKSWRPAVGVKSYVGVFIPECFLSILFSNHYDSIWVIYFRCTKVTRVVRCSKSFFALWTCKYVYVYTVMLVERKKRANTLSRVQWCSLWIKCRVELLKCGTVNADTKLACTSDCATSPVSSSPPLSFPFNMTINLHFDVWFSHFLHKNIQVQLVLLKYIYIYAADTKQLQG